MTRVVASRRAFQIQSLHYFFLKFLLIEYYTYRDSKDACHVYWITQSFRIEKKNEIKDKRKRQKNIIH